MFRYISLAMILLTVIAAKPVAGHYFGAVKDVDGYRVVFQPSPQTPVVGGDSALNFSVLENNNNIYNMYATLTITEKGSGQTIYKSQERWYETSDISIPYSFDAVGDYVATLEVRIAGDDKYEAQPLVASFDVSSSRPGVPFDELMLYYVTPAAVAITGIAVYMRSRNRI